MMPSSDRSSSSAAITYCGVVACSAWAPISNRSRAEYAPPERRDPHSHLAAYVRTQRTLLQTGDIVRRLMHGGELHRDANGVSAVGCRPCNLPSRVVPLGGIGTVIEPRRGSLRPQPILRGPRVRIRPPPAVSLMRAGLLGTPCRLRQYSTNQRRSGNCSSRLGRAAQLTVVAAPPGGIVRGSARNTLSKLSEPGRFTASWAMPRQRVAPEHIHATNLGRPQLRSDNKQTFQSIGAISPPTAIGVSNWP